MHTAPPCVTTIWDLQHADRAAQSKKERLTLSVRFKVSTLPHHRCEQRRNGTLIETFFMCGVPTKEKCFVT